MGALRRRLLPYAAELRHWFGVGLDDCVAMGLDEVEVLMQTLPSLPAVGWSYAVWADPKQMPEHGRVNVFVDDLSPRG